MPQFLCHVVRGAVQVRICCHLGSLTVPTPAQPRVLQFPAEQENPKKPLWCLFFIPARSGDQSSLCQSLPSPPARACKAAVPWNSVTFVAARLDLLLWEGADGRGWCLCCHGGTLGSPRLKEFPSLNPWQEERGCPLCAGRSWKMFSLGKAPASVCIALKGV